MLQLKTLELPVFSSTTHSLSANPMAKSQIDKILAILTAIILSPALLFFVVVVVL